MKKDKKKYEKFKVLTILIVVILIIVTAINNISSSHLYETSSYVNVFSSKQKKNKILSNYDEYQELLESTNEKATLTKQDFKKHKYLALFVTIDSCSEEVEKVTLLKNDIKKIRIQAKVNISCGGCASLTNLYLIPLKKNTDSKAKIEVKTKIKKLEKCDMYSIDKPIIYLYPETTKEVEVKLGKPENIIRSYPKYTDSWKVLAEPSGKLLDLKTNRELYSLYWEGKIQGSNRTQEGFVVKKENLIKFFEEKLSLLGLSYREQEEFIIYWVPILDNNDYTYIRFMDSTEIDEQMPLEITPKPTNTIRVWMQYKKVSSNFKTKEQQLVTPSRDGFTVVEWGGTAIN